MNKVIRILFKPIIVCMVLIFILSGCFEDKGTVIGNPDFVSSFQFVTVDTFIDSYTKALEKNGLPAEVEVLGDEKNWLAVYKINNDYTLYYDEGFIKVTFTSDDLDLKFDEVKLFVKALSLTLDPEQTAEEVDAIMLETFNREVLGEEIPWSGLYLYGNTIMYGFNLSEEGVYEIYAEDERMGH